MVYESTRPIYPEPWNTYVNYTQGYACDWSDPKKGGFYKLDTVQVALVHSLNGPKAAVEKQHLQAELAAIKILNRNGGALGKTILFTVYDAASNDQYALATMKGPARDLH